jgi:hypothetical protein
MKLPSATYQESTPTTGLIKSMQPKMDSILPNQTNNINTLIDACVKNLPADATSCIDNQHYDHNVLCLDAIETARLKNNVTLLSRHPRSGRANPLYFVFKLIAGRCIKFDACKTKQTTIGFELPDYGYDKILEERQVRRHIKKLESAGLIRYLRSNSKIKEIKLTDDGIITYWYVVKGNSGKTRVEISEEKKCPVTFEKNVRSDKEEYIEIINNNNEVDIDLVNEYEKEMKRVIHPPAKPFESPPNEFEHELRGLGLTQKETCVFKALFKSMKITKNVIVNAISECKKRFESASVDNRGAYFRKVLVWSHNDFESRAREKAMTASKMEEIGYTKPQASTESKREAPKKLYVSPEKRQQIKDWAFAQAQKEAAKRGKVRDGSDYEKMRAYDDFVSSIAVEYERRAYLKITERGFIKEDFS